jgi:DNA-damage-inducible protein D
LQQSVSPFDGLRRIDENGNEYWSARDLMPLLGYLKWERFKNVIEIARENLETVVSNIDDYASPVWEAIEKNTKIEL